MAAHTLRSNSHGADTSLRRLAPSPPLLHATPGLNAQEDELWDPQQGGAAMTAERRAEVGERRLGPGRSSSAALRSSSSSSVLHEHPPRGNARPPPAKDNARGPRSSSSSSVHHEHSNARPPPNVNARGQPKPPLPEMPGTAGVNEIAQSGVSAHSKAPSTSKTTGTETSRKKAHVKSEKAATENAELAAASKEWAAELAAAEDAVIGHRRKAEITTQSADLFRRMAADAEMELAAAKKEPITYSLRRRESYMGHPGTEIEGSRISSVEAATEKLAHAKKELIRMDYHTGVSLESMREQEGKISALTVKLANPEKALARKKNAAAAEVAREEKVRLQRNKDLQAKRDWEASDAGRAHRLEREEALKEAEEERWGWWNRRAAQEQEEREAQAEVEKKERLKKERLDRYAKLEREAQSSFPGYRGG